MPSNDPEYQEKYYKIWYRRNKKKHIKVCSVRRDREVFQNQNRMIAYLREHPCVDCGETDIVVLQFDHVRGKKTKEIGAMMQYAWKNILKEIAKCDVRCANDHVRRTQKEQNAYRVLRG